MFLAPQGNAYSDRKVHLSDIKVIMVVANSYMECDQVALRNLSTWHVKGRDKNSAQSSNMALDSCIIFGGLIAECSQPFLTPLLMA